MIRFLNNKDKIQKIVFIALIVLVFGIFTVTLITSNQKTDEPQTTETPKSNDDNKKDEKPLEDEKTKEPEPEKFNAPCDKKEGVVRHFYKVSDDKATQEMSLIQIGNKYQTSKGVTYKNENDETFDVLATLSGTVESVQESALYGTIIVIDHGNNTKSEYLGCSNAVCKVGDKVKIGDVIASSGYAQYDEASGNHVHFRVLIDNKYVDPLEVIGKKVTE